MENRNFYVTFNGWESKKYMFCSEESVGEERETGGDTFFGDFGKGDVQKML